jgi:serine phosphatase RsbU (regulator of sigma subunit)/anti-sigma regulatory factor (Ser/Thr protein kinase)
VAEVPRQQLLHRLGGPSPIGLAAFDRKLRYTAVNEWLAEFNGRSIDGHIGKTLREVVGDVADELEPVMRAILDGADPVYGIPLARRDHRTDDMRTTEASFFGLDDPSGRRFALGCVVVDTTQRERALSRVALLQDAITTVTAASDAVAAAEALVIRLLDAVDAQGSGIAFATDDGDLEFVAVAGRLGQLMLEQFPRVPISADAPICDAYRTGRSIWLPTREQWTSQYPNGAILVAHGARAAFVAPLEAEVTGRRLGILGVVFERESTFDPDDVTVMTAFAQQAAQALDRILLHDSERLMREQFQLLAALSDRLAEEIELNARVDAFLDVVVPAFALFSEVEVGGDGDARPARTSRNGQMSETHLELVQMPLVSHGEAFGSVTFGRPRYSSGDQRLADELARRLTAALENARLYARERRIAETLQLSLLPRRVPQVPGATVWARYLPGTDLVVGGDFWDVIELPRQRLLLVVGDVAGRGEPAAIVMGRLRTVIRALVDADVQPAALISALNRFLVDHEDEMATCLCALLDQTTGVVTVANAGHPPLLAVGADASTRYIGGATGLPLGVRRLATYDEQCFAVEPGATLVLFTDGLVERRNESLDDRFELLATRTAEAIDAGDAWCDRIIDAMIGAERDDDVALLGIRIDARRVPELRFDVPAGLSELRHVRERLRSWLETYDVLAADVDMLLLAAGEAASNVAMHAYGAAGGQMHVRAAIDRDGIEIVVRDDGRWRPPLDDQGRGLRIMRQTSDTTDIATGRTGTTVTIRKHVGSDRTEDGGAT